MKTIFRSFLKMSVIVIFLLKINVSNSSAQMYWNQACQFAGTPTSYVSVPSSPTIDITGNFTIEAWVNPSTLSGPSKGIISKGGILGTALRYGIRLQNSGRLSLITNGTERLVSRSSTALKENTWTYFAATYNTGTGIFRISINGINDTSTILFGAAPTSNPDSLYIGISGNTTPFTGMLDEVRIWDREVVGPYFNRHTSLGVSSGSFYTGLQMSMTFQAIEPSGVLFDFTDKSVNSNNGYGRNVTAVDMSDRLNPIINPNECIELDGNEDYLVSIDSLFLNSFSTVYFTMQCWIYPTSSNPGKLIYSPELGLNTDFSLYINNSGRIEANIEDNIYQSGPAGTIPLNRWTHVAFVMNELLGKFYVNGNLTNIDTIGIVNLDLLSHQLYIGGGPGAIQDFKGFIDEVRITENSLSQSQIIKEMYMSVDKSSHNTAATDIAYNMDGNLYDNINNGGPVLKFTGNTNFSLSATTAGKPVSPLTRRDDIDFTDGFYIKRSDKRVPASGGSGNISDSLSINKNILINDVNLFVAINHKNVSELTLVLVSPAGDSMTVFNNRSNTGFNNHLITVFDDNADSALKSNSYVSFTNTVRAESNMNSVFASENAKGFWKLRVRDNGGSDTGRLYAWGVQINNMPEREKNMNLSALIQGFYNDATNSMVKDTMSVYLYFPLGLTLIDSAKAELNSSGTGLFSFDNSSLLEDFPYFIQLKHRNAIETWASINGFDFSNTFHFTGGEGTYDFRTDFSKALGNNMIPVDLSPIRYALYNGDVNQDGTVDLADGSLIDNDSFNFASGYLPTDLNGDGVIDLADAVLADNNAANFVSAVTP